MSALEPTRCKGCGKPVLFAMDAHGKTQILDAVAPVFALQRSSAMSEPDTCVRIDFSYVSHFATCPAANKFSLNKPCYCGHRKGDHPDGACEYDTCLCPSFSVEKPKRKDPS